MDKNQLRKNIRAKRDRMKPAAVMEASALISGHFTSTLYPLLPVKGPVIVYMSTQSEARTKSIIDFLHSEKRGVYAPCVIKMQICPSSVTKSCKMIKKAFGIYEPASGKRLGSFKSVAAVIVPGIAFDMRGNRLGFGGGYFDAFLKKLPAKTLKVALAFSSQIVKSVPREPHDVKMNYIITEDGVYQTLNSKL
jgi:5-formyltetrahydrofolate cyclo-ligase